MKTGIFIALAALALAVFAVADAQGEDGGHVQQLRLSGSTFITSSVGGVVTPGGVQPVVSLSSGIVKGSGAAVFSTQSLVGVGVFQDSRCTDPLLPFGGDLRHATVVTYADGSILSWESTTGFYCTDGVVTVSETEGRVMGGEGRFEGATGTVTGTARSENGRVTTDTRVDLD
jgi:hypothetical protein